MTHTSSMMLREGTWAEQGGAGAYIWLAIYVGLIIVGLTLVGSCLYGRFSKPQ